MTHSSKTFLTSAPAKVILFGEHGVVYGEPCVAASLNLRTYGFCSIDQKEDGSSLILECLDIGLIYNSSLPTAAQPDDTDSVGMQNREAALKAFLTIAQSLGVTNGRFIVKSEIPVGAGLGSSASYAVVISTLLLLASGEISISNHSDKIEISSAIKEKINELAFMGEKVIHGQPSGVDNTLVCYGGAKLYQKDTATNAIKLNDLPGFSQFKPTILLVNTKVPKNTMHQVSMYRKRLQDMPVVMHHITKGIGAVAMECTTLFGSAAILPSDCEEQFGRLINMNHCLLAAAGMSCLALDQVHFNATSLNGMASKLTGAGGGGCALCFIPTNHNTGNAGNPSTLTAVLGILDSLGMECYETRLGVDGITAFSFGNEDAQSFRTCPFSSLQNKMLLLILLGALCGNKLILAAKPPLKELEVEITKPVANCDTKATNRDRLKMHYTGKLYENDQQFETSVGGAPFEFVLGRGNVIEGWDKGIPGMCVGEKRRLSIPYPLAYGESGSPPAIPPKADLVFDIQLMSVNEIDLPSSYLVHDLPDVSSEAASKATLYAGHIQVRQWKYFHILVKENIPSPATATNKKLMFWFNGGPGCSSMDGMFLENGPFRFDTSKSPPPLVLNEKGWWRDADIVYIDHPPGTGYSLGTTFTSSTQVVENFPVFLDEFLLIHSNYEGKPIYIGGESFAGVWIPQITSKLIDLGYPVSGILLGSPWIDPVFQYPAILDYSKELSLISGETLKNAESRLSTCLEEMKPTPRKNTYQSCERIMDLILQASQEGGQFCMNKYDYTLRDHGPNEGCGMSWPDGVTEMKVYLARDDVKTALHARQYLPNTWEECAFAVYESIIGDTGEPTITLFPKLLKSLQISIFGGDRDLLCNILGLERSLQNLGVDDSKKDIASRLKPWGSFGSKVFVGGNLTYFRLKNTSHMAPFDAPEASREVFLDSIQQHPAQARPKSSTKKEGDVKSVPNAKEEAQKDTNSTKIPATDPPQKQPPSHIFAAFFLLGFFFVAVFGGLYIRKKLHPPRSKWDAVPVQTEEEIEMQEPYDYEGRHLTAGIRDDD